MALLAIAFLAVLFQPEWRAKLRWRVPAFREASLAQLASVLALMLEKGTPLPEALALAANLEGNTGAGKTLTAWRDQVQAGNGKPAQWAAGAFPPLFLWLVRSAGENLADGFRKASEIYQARASYKIELALYGALPISILFLAQLVFWQLAPVARACTTMMNILGSN